MSCGTLLTKKSLGEHFRLKKALVEHLRQKNLKGALKYLKFEFVEQ
jgi:hypothetical protein